MDWLKNLFSSAGSTITNFLSGFKSGAPLGANLSSSVSPTISINPLEPRMSIAPTGSVVPSSTFLSQGGRSTVQGLESNAFPGQTFTSVPGGYASITPGINYSVRPAVPQTTQTQNPTGIQTDQYGRQTGFVSQSGMFTPAPQAPSGLSGTGGFSAPAGATTGISGASGTGRSAFTGTLGAAGGFGTQSLTGTQNEEERKRQQALNPQFMSGQGLTLSKDAFGNIVLGQPPKPTGFTAGQAPSTIEPPAGIQGQLTPQVAQSYQDFINYAQQQVDTIRQKIEQMAPTPQEPVVDTQAQLDFLKQQPPETQNTLKQQLDQWRRESGMMGFESERINILKDLQAARESRDVIIKEIEDNPDLPKGLAARRKAEVDKDYNERVQSATNRLQIVTQQIGDLNDQLNMQFKIYESDQQKQERLIDNQRQTVQQFISTGALGNFTDQQLQQIADSGLGYDYNALKTMRAAIKSGSDTKIAQAEERLQISQERLSLAQERANQPSAADVKDEAAVTRFAPSIENEIFAGKAPQDALNRAIQDALASGVTLSVTEQNAILQYANAVKAQFDTASQQQQQASTQPSPSFGSINQTGSLNITGGQTTGVTGGFYSALFGS